MENETGRNIKLGLFVLSGLVILISSLYIIGKNKNLFGSTITIQAKFYNTGGLITGDNVRLMGINIGTVKKIEILSDTIVNVVMLIDKNASSFIKKNSIAKIGSDGLMGNKLINIEPGSPTAETIHDGDQLSTYRAIETSEMLETLYITNENVNAISADIKEISARINSENSIWNILSDTILRNNLKQSVKNFQNTSFNSVLMSEDLIQIINNIKKENGIAGKLIHDSVLRNNFQHLVSNMQKASIPLVKSAVQIQELTTELQSSHSALHIITSDTGFANDVSQSLKNINKGALAFSENMEALKSNILVRRYFKKKNKLNQNCHKKSSQ